MPEVAARDECAAWAAHGVDLGPPNGSGQRSGECPFCGEPKLSVAGATGVGRCFQCHVGPPGKNGVHCLNPTNFLRELWATAERYTTDAKLDFLAVERGLLSADSLRAFGVRVHPLTREYCVPGRSLTDGEVGQLYRFCEVPGGRKRLYATPGLPHQVHGPLPLGEGVETVWLCEGPWDGAALHEALSLRPGGLGTDAVLAVPGCGVFPEGWAKFLGGKVVVLCFDSDRPRERPPGSGKFTTAGRDAARRTAGVLSKCSSPPREVRWLAWGPEGYDPTLPDGHDVRDFLRAFGGGSASGRLNRLEILSSKVETVPAAWGVGTGGSSSPQGRPPVRELAPLRCGSFAELVTAWRRALRWRREMQDVLTVMLAVALSTDQSGDQLFLQVIADAGSAKTRFCDAMLVSKACFSLEHMTGFHSGWNDGSGEDFSLITRINHKTLITPEGDVMMSSPRFAEIMSQQRRIFDGSTGASYKNKKDDTKYTGLRTPWIIAGTPALMQHDQSRLGDRFLRVCLNRPGDDETKNILRQVGFSALRSVVCSVNGAPETSLDEHMALAYRLTGGWVDRLRAEAADRLRALVVDGDALVDECMDLGEFVADLRARPEPSRRAGQSPSEAGPTKEMPTRLTHQFVRLACCVAAATDAPTTTPEVMRVVRKVALDTARGPTLILARHLFAAGAGGLQAGGLAVMSRADEAETRNLLKFMRAVGAAESFSPGKGTRQTLRWRLTERLRELYERAVVDA